jgi:hypothetical protein
MQQKRDRQANCGTTKITVAVGSHHGKREHGRRLAEMPVDKRSIVAAITEMSTEPDAIAAQALSEWPEISSCAAAFSTDCVALFFVYVKPVL